MILSFALPGNVWVGTALTEARVGIVSDCQRPEGASPRTKEPCLVLSGSQTTSGTCTAVWSPNGLYFCNGGRHPVEVASACQRVILVADDAGLGEFLRLVEEKGL